MMSGKTKVCFTVVLGVEATLQTKFFCKRKQRPNLFVVALQVSQVLTALSVSLLVHEYLRMSTIAILALQSLSTVAYSALVEAN